MKIGSTKIVVKPAMFVLVGAVLVGIVVVGVAEFSASSHAPAYGLVKPKGWKFDAHGGAQASASMGGQQVGGSGLLDSDSGFRVAIVHPGGSPDQVSVSNGFNLDQVTASTLTLSFEAKAPKKFPLVASISGLGALAASSAGPVWRQRIDVDSRDWSSYQATIPVDDLRKTNLMSLVVSLQMGGIPGEVSLRNIQIR